MIKFRYVDGCLVQTKPVLSSQKFPESNVEPDSAYTIRKIYDNWTKGKPTSPHVFDCEYDEDGVGFDDSDSHDDFRENPIDRSQVHNDMMDSLEAYTYEKETVETEKRRRKAQQQQPQPQQ